MAVATVAVAAKAPPPAGLVRPMLDYVTDNADGTFTAWFGYDHRGDKAVRLPIGHDNRFTPPAANRGQPIVFEPGRHRRVFAVAFPRGGLVWHLAGKTAEAKPNRRPTVRLVRPRDGTTITEPGRIKLRAEATDPDGRVARVKFFREDIDVGMDASAPYACDVRGLAAGQHRFHAVAYDNRGAPSADSNEVTVTVLGKNRPPTVRLTAPADGATFTAPATITLAADAADPDGSVARVTFLQGDATLGEVLAAPFTLTWSPPGGGEFSLRASATDDRGATTVGAAVTVSVGASAALPLVANFEPGEGYGAGELDGQGGWTATGDVQVVTAPVFAGTQAVTLAAGQPSATAERTFAAAAVTYLDVFLRPVAGSAPETSTQWHTPGAGLALVAHGDRGVVALLAGDGAGGARWRETAVSLPCDGTGAADWQRFTIRENHGTRTWDFYANGAMRAANLAFADAAHAGLAGVRLIGHAAAATGLDDVLAAAENPLFVDADNDGMEDAWETAHGLDVARDDRDADADADGLTNIAEYVLGTDPARTDSDDDGMPDGWESSHGSDPVVDDAMGDPDRDGVGNLVEYLQGRHPLRGVVADAAGRVSLRIFQPGS